jgi:hypothetical protein
MARITTSHIMVGFGIVGVWRILFDSLSSRQSLKLLERGVEDHKRNNMWMTFYHQDPERA